MKFSVFLEKAQVKGHYRTTPSGKKVWVGPHDRKRGRVKREEPAPHKDRFHYFSWGRAIGPELLDALKPYGVLDVGNSGDGWYGRGTDLKGFGYIYTRRPVPPEVLTRLGLQEGPTEVGKSLYLVKAKQPVQKPGSRGGKGYYDDKGQWQYGERPTAPAPAPVAEEGEAGLPRPLDIVFAPGTTAGARENETYRKQLAQLGKVRKTTSGHYIWSSKQELRHERSAYAGFTWEEVRPAPVGLKAFLEDEKTGHYVTLSGQIGGVRVTATVRTHQKGEPRLHSDAVNRVLTPGMAYVEVTFMPTEHTPDSVPRLGMKPYYDYLAAPHKHEGGLPGRLCLNVPLDQLTRVPVLRGLAVEAAHKTGEVVKPPEVETDRPAITADERDVWLSMAFIAQDLAAGERKVGSQGFDGKSFQAAMSRVNLYGTSRGDFMHMLHLQVNHKRTPNDEGYIPMAVIRRAMEKAVRWGLGQGTGTLVDSAKRSWSEPFFQFTADADQWQAALDAVPAMQTQDDKDLARWREQAEKGKIELPNGAAPPEVSGPAMEYLQKYPDRGTARLDSYLTAPLAHRDEFRTGEQFHIWKTAHDDTRSGVKDNLVSELAQRTGLPYATVNAIIGQWSETSNDGDRRSLQLQREAAAALGVRVSLFQEERERQCEAKWQEQVDKIFTQWQRWEEVRGILDNPRERNRFRDETWAAGDRQAMYNLQGEYSTLRNVFQRPGGKPNQFLAPADKTREGVAALLRQYPEHFGVSSYMDLAPPEDIRKVVRAMYQYTQEDLERAGLGPEDDVTLYRGVRLPRQWADAGPGVNNGDVVSIAGSPLESYSLSQQTAATFGNQAQSDEVGVVISIQVPRRAIVATFRTGMGCMTEGEVVLCGATPEQTVRVEMLYLS